MSGRDLDRSSRFSFARSVGSVCLFWRSSCLCLAGLRDQSCLRLLAEDAASCVGPVMPVNNAGNSRVYSVRLKPLQGRGKSVPCEAGQSWVGAEAVCCHQFSEEQDGTKRPIFAGFFVKPGLTGRIGSISGVKTPPEMSESAIAGGCSWGRLESALG